MIKQNFKDLDARLDDENCESNDLWFQGIRRKVVNSKSLYKILYMYKILPKLILFSKRFYSSKSVRKRNLGRLENFT